MFLDSLGEVLVRNSLITAFVFVGVLVWLSYLISTKLTRGHIHGSAIAITLGRGLGSLAGSRVKARNG